MCQSVKRVTDGELARFFIETVEKEAIIPEIFNIFGLTVW